MKFTLKNRPETICPIGSEHPWCNPRQSALWFEGFEKELKDFMLSMQQCNFAGYYDKAVYDKLKEILGE